MLILEMISWIPNYLSSVPLHSQLAKIIRQKIHSQVLLSGQTLPAATYTSLKLGVSAHIVKCAYEELEENNLGKLQNDGTFVICIKNPFIDANLFYTENQLSERTRY